MTGEPTVRNWRQVTPYVDHESAIIWPIFRGRGHEGVPPEAAALLDMVGFTIHRMQGGRSGDYHEHEDKEQVYYFTEGRGRMKLDGKFYDVREGDAVHIPPRVKHQLINDSDDWITHLLVTAPVRV